MAKVCRICGIDVSKSKRIRDDDGTYWCPACFDAAGPGLSAEASATLIPQAKSKAPAKKAQAKKPVAVAPEEDDNPFDAPRAAQAPKPAKQPAPVGKKPAAGGAGTGANPSRPGSAARPAAASAPVAPEPSAPEAYDWATPAPRSASAGSDMGAAPPPISLVGDDGQLLDWPDAAAIEAAQERDVVYFPCRVCECLFKPEEVYAEEDGETICKPCWKTRTAIGNSPTALPLGLELAPAPSTGLNDAVFCEHCNRIFAPEKLSLAPDGPVLCRPCSILLARRRLEQQRRAEKLAAFTDKTPKKKKVDKNALAKTLVSLLLAGAGVVWLLYRAGVFEDHHRKYKAPPKNETPAAVRQ